MLAKVCLLIGIYGLNICLATELQTSWERNLRVAQELFDKGHYLEAEKECLEGVRVAWQFGGEDPRLAKSWNNLGVIERAVGRAAEAETHFLGAISILEKAVPPDDPNLAAAWGNLGELYLASNRPGDARPLLERA